MPAKLMKFVDTFEHADQPSNAILMRSDIHDYFDDYQFGFMETVSVYQTWLGNYPNAKLGTA